MTCLVACCLLCPAEAGPETGPVNLGPAVNSPDSDFGPIVTADGNALYFTSDREGGQGGQDIWVSYRVKGEWTGPENLGSDINTKYNEGPDSFTASADTMYFTRCDRLDQQGICDIFTAEKDEESGEWKNVERMAKTVNSDYNDANASVSHDGKTLYFVSDRPGPDGQQDWDIFVSRRILWIWTAARRLGPPVNTERNEIHVHIHQDGEKLYFSSDGHGGLGGTDILMSRIEDGEFASPVNVGSPINTTRDDMYFTIPASGDQAYLASGRAGTLGREDIYSVPLLAEVKGQGMVVVKGLVLDRSTCLKKTGQGEEYDPQTCKPVSGAVLQIIEPLSGNLVKKVESGPDGGFNAAVPAGRNYSVRARAQGYRTDEEKIDAAKKSPYQVIQKNIFLDPAR